MQTEKELKDLVRDKYSAIALQNKDENTASCCGATCCTTEVYSIMSDDYTQMEGYNADADLGLGCGLPTQFANIKKGDVVIDLGSGAGNDCFIARAESGESGKVIGIDFTPAMIERARANAEKLSFYNVEFRQGDIEQLPVTSAVADVIVSNCVLNLVPNKAAVFGEMFRVLKPGGHFCISDVVLKGELPEAFRQVAEFYAGCISGAIQKDDYLNLIEAAGFTNLVVQKEKVVVVPDDILHQHFAPEAIEAVKKHQNGIFSITVYADKPAACCAPGCC